MGTSSDTASLGQLVLPGCVMYPTRAAPSQHQGRDSRGAGSAPQGFRSEGAPHPSMSDRPGFRGAGKLSVLRARKGKRAHRWKMPRGARAGLGAHDSPRRQGPGLVAATAPDLGSRPSLHTVPGIPGSDGRPLAHLWPRAVWGLAPSEPCELGAHSSSRDCTGPRKPTGPWLSRGATSQSLSAPGTC